MPESDADTPLSGDERGREAVAHLQRAALEFIEAARIILDIAEEAVLDPSAVAAVVSETLTGLAAAARVRPAGPPKADAGGTPRPRVEHIRIS